MDSEMQGYLFAFLFFAALGLMSFALWRVLSALRSHDANIRKDAKRKAFIGLCTLVIAAVAMAVIAFVYSEVDIRIGDAGRFASRNGRTIELHPSEVTFQIPQDWLDWDAQFHNNLHLTHGQLRSVRLGHGEWDSEYGAVVNSALPFEDCAAHVGGEGWGWSGVSFGDLQVRAYVSELRSYQVLSAISKQGFKTAQGIAERQHSAGNGAVLSSSTKDKWQYVEISYPLWYGDYGGTARINFYVKDIGRYRLVIVFMGGSNQNEKDSILNSVEIPSSSKSQPSTTEGLL
jgi:hypothetical protein